MRIRWRAVEQKAGRGRIGHAARLSRRHVEYSITRGMHAVVEVWFDLLDDVGGEAWAGRACLVNPVVGRGQDRSRRGVKRRQLKMGRRR